MIGLALLVAGLVVSDRTRAETTVGISYFDKTLSAHGYWVNDQQYGRVWRPSRLPDGWRPYAYGNWAYTRDYGWVWVSDEPYGWVVYHYGRWVWSTRYGWVWLAGYEWAPAWVEWCYGGGYVGWAPVGPDFYWQGDYYYGGYDCASPAFYSHAVFVSEAYYGRPGMHSHFEPSSRNATAARATVNVTTYGRGPSGITNRSVDVAKLEAATGQAINPVSVMSTNAPVPAGVDTQAVQELKIFRPSVVDTELPKLEAPSSLILDPAQSDLTKPLATDRWAAEAIPPIPAQSVPPLQAPTAPGRLSIPDVGRSLPVGFTGGGGLGGGALGGAGGLLGR